MYFGDVAQYLYVTWMYLAAIDVKITETWKTSRTPPLQFTCTNSIYDKSTCTLYLKILSNLTVSVIEFEKNWPKI